MKPVTQEWLNRAKDDLDVVAEIIEIAHLTNIAAFHCQQAIEKSFKAILEEQGKDVIRVHSLVRLYHLVKKHLEVNVEELTLAEISDTYIEARYPPELGLLPHGKPSVEDANRFHQAAQIVYDDVVSFLPDNKEDNSVLNS